MLALCELFACQRAFDETPVSSQGEFHPKESGRSNCLVNHSFLIQNIDALPIIAAVWQLVVLSGWAITVCEDVVREALRYIASRKWEARPDKGYEGEGEQCEFLHTECYFTFESKNSVPSCL